MNIYNVYPYFYAAGSIPKNIKFTSNQNGGTPTINIKGDQELDTLLPKSGYAKLCTIAQKDSSNFATVTFRSTSSASTAGGYKFTGKLNICYYPTDPSYVWTTTAGAESTMTGSLIVSNGTMSVAGTAAYNTATGIVVAAGATFSCTSTAANPLASVSAIELGEGATLELPSGTALNLVYCKVADKFPKSGWYTGSDNANPEEGDLQTIAGLKGEGRIYVPFQGSTSEATWTGEGGADTSVSSAANWGGELPELTEGGTIATFATGGALATFGADAAFKSLTFSNPGLFTFAALNDAVVSVAEGLTVTSGAVELGAPIKMTGEQTWTIAADSALTNTAPISSEGAVELTVSGAGTAVFAAESSFTGSLVLKNAQTRIGTEKLAFGPATPGSKVTLDNKNSGAAIKLEGTEIEKDFVISKTGSNGNGGVTFKAGSTNVFSGSITVSGSNWVPKPGNGTQLVFAGGGSLSTYFRPENNFSLIIRNQPISIGTGFLVNGFTTIFEVSSNTVDGLAFYGTGTVNCRAPYVFKTATSIAFNNQGNNDERIYLNGNDQSVGNISGYTSHPVYCSFTTPADKPASLKFVQTSNATLSQYLFAGPISLVKSGAARVTVNSAMNTTGGDLTVKAGTLAIVENGRFGSVTNVVVAGGTLCVSNSQAFAHRKLARLELGEGAALDIGDGVRIRVSEFVVNGIPRNGLFDSGSLPNVITGDGEIRAGSIGAIMLVR